MANGTGEQDQTHCLALFKDRFGRFAIAVRPAIAAASGATMQPGLLSHILNVGLINAPIIADNANDGSARGMLRCGKIAVFAFYGRGLRWGERLVERTRFQPGLHGNQGSHGNGGTTDRVGGASVRLGQFSSIPGSTATRIGSQIADWPGVSQSEKPIGEQNSRLFPSTGKSPAKPGRTAPGASSAGMTG